MSKTQGLASKYKRSGNAQHNHLFEMVLGTENL